MFKQCVSSAHKNHMLIVSKYAGFSDNKGKKGVNPMDDMISALRRIGLPEEECARIRDMYRDDLDGLTTYVLYMLAMFDDAHEYV